MEAQARHWALRCQKLADYESLGSTVLSVNLPQIQNPPSGPDPDPPPAPQTCRAYWQGLNAKIGDHDVNIAGRCSVRGTSSATSSQTWTTGPLRLVAELEALPETVRVRTVVL